MPLGSPEFPRQPMRGRVMGTGTRGCKGWMGMGVRRGMAGMDDRPTDRLGIEPIPVRRKDKVNVRNNSRGLEHAICW